MNIPEDLTVDIRGGHLYLASNGRVVDLEIGGRHGVFADGSVSWKRLQLMFLAPALSQLSEAAVSAEPNGSGASS